MSVDLNECWDGQTVDSGADFHKLQQGTCTLGAPPFW
jgi:hypothetical protein